MSITELKEKAKIMRDKQIEKVSQGPFIVTSALAVCLLLLNVVVYPDLPVRVPIYVNFWDEGDSFGPESSILMWPVVLFGLSIYQRSYQSVQLYSGWPKVLLIIANLDALFNILRLFVYLLT